MPPILKSIEKVKMRDPVGSGSFQDLNANCTLNPTRRSLVSSQFLIKLTEVLILVHQEFHFVVVFVQISLRLYQIKFVPERKKENQIKNMNN
jgi:hypothetical protein